MELKEGFIICDSKTKESILKSQNGFKNLIFLTLNDLKDKLLGYAVKSSIFEIMSKYEITYDMANEYIKYMPFIEDKYYSNEKLDSILSCKKYLIKMNLYKYDYFFKYRLSQFPVTFIDSSKSHVFEYLKNEIAKYTEVYVVDEANKDSLPIVYEFNNSYDEELYVCNKIYELINSGVKGSKIHIANMNASYEFIFKRLAKSYNIPIKFNKDTNILSTKIANDFISLCNELDNFNEIFDKINDGSNIYNQIFNLINDYDLNDSSPLEYLPFIKRKMKNMTYQNNVYEDMINVSNGNKYFDDEYVFYIGFNLGVSPAIYKDIEYLNDYELSIINLDTSIDKNLIAKNDLINLLLKTKNIYVSYSLSDSSGKLLPSNLINELGIKVEKREAEYGYSALEDNIRMGIAYSKYLKYKISDNALEEYDISHLKYGSYDNKYKPINKELLDDLFNDRKLSFSYSSIKTFFACPFQFYANRILGLNEYESSIATRMGAYAHAVLEDSYNSDFDFNESTNIHMDMAENAKDKFYFSQMKKVLAYLVKYNKSKESLSKFDLVLREPNIVYEESDFKFEGFVDKVLYTEVNGEIYCAIIDYKTGSDIASLNNVEDGYNLQLPSYMYLLSKYDGFKNKKINIIGIYLQKVNIIDLDNRLDIKEQLEKSFRLEGYTISERNLIPYIDPLYENSDYIKGMAFLKSGELSKKSKVISIDDQNKLISLVDSLIHQASDDIHNAKFDIKPKILNKTSSCTYCKYKDLCNVAYDDFEMLVVKPFLEKDGE